MSGPEADDTAACFRHSSHDPTSKPWHGWRPHEYPFGKNDCMLSLTLMLERQMTDQIRKNIERCYGVQIPA
jgi:hypothetical protein